MVGSGYFDGKLYKNASSLREGVLILEIVFVGQCEVVVCFDFVEKIFFPLGHEANRSANRVSISF